MRAFSKRYINVTIAFGEVMKSEDSEFLRKEAWAWIYRTTRTLELNYKKSHSNA